MLQLTISLVIYNGQDYLPACLGSLKKQKIFKQELFLIDNYSQDESVEYIKKEILPYWNNVKLIVNQENIGFARAHNQVIRNSQSPFIFLLNQDVILDKNYLAEAVDFLEKNPRVGAVSGKILRLTNGKKTNKIDSLGLEIFRSQRVVEKGAASEDKADLGDSQEIFGVSGALPLYRREALEEVKIGQEYFDEDFFSYKEDVDLAYRLRWRGWASFYLPAARAYHARGAASQGEGNLAAIRGRKKKSAFVNYHSYKNHFFVLLKNLSLHNYFFNFPWIKCYEIKKFIYLLFCEPKTLAGLGKIFKLLPTMWKKRKFIMSSRKVASKEISQWFI